MITLLLAAGCSAIGFLSVMNYLLFPAAISIGAIGGLVHELAQSGGQILFIKKKEDGVYLGSLTGMILGAIAGLLVLRSYVSHTISSQAQIQTSTNTNSQTVPLAPLDFTLEVLFAGLALKGIAEAATGSQVEKLNKEVEESKVVKNQVSVSGNVPQQLSEKPSQPNS